MIKELRILGDKTLFDTEANYVIPRYQRAYAWEDKEIIQLIEDINDIENTELYYLGSLIVSRVKDKFETYEVVDGQQRLTTLYLLLQFLVSEGTIEKYKNDKEDICPRLSFDCRNNSNFTLRHIQEILAGSINSEDEEKLEQSIINGLKAIRQKFLSDGSLDKINFVKKLKQVVLYRIEVPKHTDLNRYFEIMNTRGEQLEQHDILKARLMGYLQDRNDQELFAKIWNACSDMTGYIQMHFSPAERAIIFGPMWNQIPSDDWNKYKDELKCLDVSGFKGNIKEIISPEFKINNIDGTDVDNVNFRFESIIDFPHFLLHALRSFIKVHDLKISKNLGELLDDKKLLVDYETVVKNGCIKEKPIADDKINFSRLFIMHLLKARFLFDKFIIKREYMGDDSEGEWSLKELNNRQKKPVYTDTKFNYYKEWEQTYQGRNKECRMIEAALRVSYTSPKVMHWITDLLVWLFQNNSYPGLIGVAEKVASEAIKKNFLIKENYEMGVETPHIVFNFLDYLLWKENKVYYSDFEFEFRNSVEHFYPQHPSDGSFDKWNGVDTFGNLCIISRNVNSKFSNLSPESKMKSYNKIINMGSIKLRKMGEIIQSSSNELWIKEKCKEHENEMIEVLKNYCEKPI